MRPQHILSRLTEFRSSQHGSVAIVFSFAIVALLLTGGIAVDFGRSIATQAKLQAAADAAILAASREAAGNSGMSEADVKTFARDHFNTALNTTQTLSVTSFNLSEVDGGYELEVEATLPAMLTTVVGITELDITAYTRAVAGGSRPLEVALALDNTDSMSGTKIAALKDAANVLVDQLMGDGTDPDNQTKIGLVPFDDYVNVGLANRNETWISVPDDYSETVNQCYNEYPNKTGCSTTTTTQTCYSDGVPYDCTVTTEQCTDWGDPVETCGDVTKNYVWKGCVGSRDNGLNLVDTDYLLNPVPGILNASCPDNEITPLTDDKTVITAEIDAMSADSKTYIPSGLAWAWRVLSSHAPYEGGLPYNDIADQAGIKAIVLMTDGANTRGPDWPEGEHDQSGTAAEAEANTITTQLCTNIRASNIVIYTITFEITDPTIQTLMDDCASDAGKSFDADSSIQLTDAFQTIASSLSKLRLSQ